MLWVTTSVRAEPPDVCMEFLTSHLEDADWMEVCIGALQNNVEPSSALSPETGAAALSTLSIPGLTCGPDAESPVNVNMSKLQATQNEVSIAVDPNQPNRLFAFSNSDPIGTGLFAAYSTDGGGTWKSVDSDDGIIADGDAEPSLPVGRGDPWVTFDGFGNLFISYFAGTTTSVGPATIALSTDGGETFEPNPLALFGIAGDRPTIAAGSNQTTGVESLWAIYSELSPPPGMAARSSEVIGLGAVGLPFNTETLPDPVNARHPDIAIGPDGHVVLAYQSEALAGFSTIRVTRDPDGIGPMGFSAPLQIVGTNMSFLDDIPAQPMGVPSAAGGIAYDVSDGPYRGRVYLAYTDEIINESNDMDIFVRFSTNDGASWSEPVRVNDDTTRSQFLPRIAVDPSSGHVAVSWHDARNDSGAGSPTDHDGEPNTDAEMYATLSINGGEEFLPNIRVSAGSSNQTGTLSSRDYGDYTGLAFAGGMFHPAWSDNSNSTLDNPGVPPPTDPPTDLVPLTTNDAYTATCGLDSDGDGVMDARDNCMLVANAAPNDCDTDEDGYGNYCDGDFDQSFSVNAVDFSARFLPDFKVGTDQAPIDGTDMDCGGTVNATDFSEYFYPSFKSGALGPSGLACAGTIPCPDL